MRTLVFLTVLAVVSCLAGDAVSVGPEPPSEYNAHWQLIPGAGVGCVRDDLYVYGSNDAASMMWVGQPINLGGYDGVSITLHYTLETADEGDYAEIYLSDGLTYHSLCKFEGNTDGVNIYKTALDDYYGCRNLGIYIVWVSDETGVASGFRLNTIRIDGVNWGEGDYTNIFTWGSDEVTGHQTINVADFLLSGYLCCFGFKYGTDLDTQGWWAVDNVELLVNGASILPLQGGGYGIEDFESGGWHQDRHGLSGEWEIDTDHITGDMSGANLQCDSAARPGWLYEAETFSPWVTVSAVNTATAVFDTWFHPAGTDESASLGYYSASGFPIFEDTFDDLYYWECYDGGEDVVTTSWGEIKASF
ncbi:MAG: hypothetical protein NTW26_08530 [bacterium]|nr:hypothetical protein [bacterium]